MVRLRQQLERAEPLRTPARGRISRQLKHLPIQPEVSIRPDERGQYQLLSITAGDRPAAQEAGFDPHLWVEGHQVMQANGPLLDARALAMPDVQKRAQDFGMQVVGSRPEQFDAFIASEIKRWGRIIAEAKIEQE